MFRRNFLSQVTIRLALELIHGDSDYAAAAFVGAATGCFHHSGITTRADGESGVGQQLAGAQSLGILEAAFFALRAAKDSYNAFVRGHILRSPTRVPRWFEITVHEPSDRLDHRFDRVC